MLSQQLPNFVQSKGLGVQNWHSNTMKNSCISCQHEHTSKQGKADCQTSPARQHLQEMSTKIIRCKSWTILTGLRFEHQVQKNTISMYRNTSCHWSHTSFKIIMPFYTHHTAFIAKLHSAIAFVCKPNKLTHLTNIPLAGKLGPVYWCSTLAPLQNESQHSHIPWQSLNTIIWPQMNVFPMHAHPCTIQQNMRSCNTLAGYHSKAMFCQVLQISKYYDYMNSYRASL